MDYAGRWGQESETAVLECIFKSLSNWHKSAFAYVGHLSWVKESDTGFLRLSFKYKQIEDIFLFLKFNDYFYPLCVSFKSAWNRKILLSYIYNCMETLFDFTFTVFVPCPPPPPFFLYVWMEMLTFFSSSFSVTWKKKIAPFTLFPRGSKEGGWNSLKVNFVKLFHPNVLAYKHT